MFGRKKSEASPRVFDFKTQLATKPVRNLKISITPDPAGHLTISVPLVYRGAAGLFARLFKPRTQRRYRIDGPPLEIWNLIDGQARVADLMAHLEAKHQLRFFEARAMVIHLLGLWMGRGLIAIDTRVEADPK